MANVSTRNRNKNQYYKDGRKKPANWEYRFPIASIGGQRKHASRAGYKTQREAQEAGIKALNEYMNSGQQSRPSEMSVADYMDLWLAQYVYASLRPNSQSTYKGIVNNHIKPALGHYKLSTLSPATLQGFVNGQKEKGFSKQHVDLILSTFKGALNFAIEPLQLIQKNPMQYVKAPKMEKTTRTRIILSMEDWERIIERFPFDSKHHVPLMIGFHTGLRIGETMGLTWDDIDLDNGTITVSKQQIRFKPNESAKKVWCFAPPKSHASNRTIKIGRTLVDVLKKHKTRQKENKLACGEYYARYSTRHIKEGIHEIMIDRHGENNLVCTDESGAWCTPETFRYCSKVIQRQLGIRFEFHALRHTHATLLAESGANPKSLQMRLGHEKIETTLQTYIHNTKAMEDETVGMFERILSTR